MMNAIGYSSKLLLMCSALEALVRSPVNFQGKRGKNNFLSVVIGDELNEKIWKQKTGIRHRLIHGEYFNGESDKENYLQQIHEKIIEYFNEKILLEEAINKNVKNPQRHPDGNKIGGSYFIKRTNESPLFNLRSLTDGCNEDLSVYLAKFETSTEDDFEFSC